MSAVGDELESGSFDAGRYLDRLREESTAMPDHTRQTLFDEWFASAYDESG